jgi:hypothetical protein
VTEHRRCPGALSRQVSGTLAAARFIVDNIVELHRDLKNRHFSTIIECEFDPKDRKKIISTK